MQQYIATLIALILSHTPLVMLLLALVISTLICIFGNKYPSQGDHLNTFIAYIMLLAVGFSGIWGFVMHAFYPQLAAHFIGWVPSPFQFEVAVANLGMGVAGILSFKNNCSFRAATTVMVTCFSWGAAAGHLIQLCKTQDVAPGNIGAIFYTDILIPLILIILLVLHKKCNRNVFR